MSRKMTLARLGVVLGLAANAVCRSGYSQEHPDPKAGNENTRATSALECDPANSFTAAAPPPFRFVGEMSIGRTRYYAVQDTEKRTAAWYQARDRVGEYEIVGLRDSCLLLQSASRSLLLPLNGALITGERGAATSAKIQSTPEAPPTIRMYLDGKFVEGTPNQLSPEQLKQFNDSKEALLKVRDKVSADIAPMVDQALESNSVVISSGKEGLKRSDFPPEMAAKLDDATLAKINAAIKSDGNNLPPVTPPKN